MPLQKAIRGRRFAALIAVAVASFCACPALGEEDPELLAFLATYHCAVADLIARIHANPEFDDQDRFIILNPVDRPSSYVQCAFDNADREALCEAASDFYAPEDPPYLGSLELRALARLGFDMDGSRENFRQRLYFSQEMDPAELARFMLTALYGGYGARESSDIEVRAPFVMPHGILPRKQCPPTS